MNRRRPLVWLVVSVVCFIGALYFWRLGDKWQAQKSPAPAASNTPGTPANPSTPHARMVAKWEKTASTAPVVALNPPATNSPVLKKTNGFPYRLSNTTRTIGQLSRDNHAILLENALIDSSSSAALEIPDALKSHGDPGAYLVQASGPMNDSLRNQIVAAGGTIVSYIPNNAYVVTGTSAMADQLSPNFNVRPWEPYFKIKASLIPAALDGQPIFAANVAVFPGELEQTKAALDQLGVTIFTESPSPFGTQLALRNVRSIAGVAQLPGIHLVEPSFARVSANDLTRVIMSDSIDEFVPTNYLGLSGSNVLVAVPDSWAQTNGASVFNPDLTNIISDPNIFPVGIADLEGHATHVGGIIAGSGLHSPTNAVGSAPGADFRGKAPASKLYPLPLFDLSFTDAKLEQVTALTNALISNNSWDYQTSDYNLAAADYDQAVRDSVPGMTGPQPLIYVFAAGNSGAGDDGGEGGVPDSILSPAVGKNVLTIGAGELPRNITNSVTQCDDCVATNVVCTTNNPWAGMTDSRDQVARFSSRGNVGIGMEGDFGRFKPDLVAPGTFVVSTRSMTWDTNAYYNPVSDNITQVLGDTVDPTNYTFYSTFVPCDAIQLTIQAVALRPTPLDLPIYGEGNNFPVPPANFLGSNLVSGTIAGGPDFTLSPVDTFWYYAVGNPTNVQVTYNVFADVQRTNEMGDYWDILRTNLNDQLLSSNPPAGFPPTLYRYESGTSMAAPAVAGTLALMEDFFTNRLGRIPSPALMKGLLINGARSMNPMYDFQVRNNINYQGWGLVNLTNSLPPGITNAYNASAPMIMVDQDVTNALATGDSRTLFVNVNSNAQSAPLRVTLVWTDPPGNPAASIKLVNNLDLIVTNLDDPTNPVVYFGNDFDTGELFTSQWNGDTNNIPSDNINNVENVYVNFTLGTNYSITVAARNVNVNALTTHTNGVVQDYALVISCGNGDITNALTLTNGPVIGSSVTTLTTVTNQFTDSPDTSGGLLTGQRVGASSPLQGTNSVALTNQTQWGSNGLITLGVTNQWHFYVITNTVGTNATGAFTNAAFATFLPPNLSVTPGGVHATDPDGATRPEADIDLYVARGSGAWNLTNLDLTVVAGADKSLSRGGTEFLVYSNAQPNEVFYIGVKAEDQEAAEYDFLALFAENPFSTMGPNGEQYLHGLNVPTPIPDGTPEKPGNAYTIAIAVQPIAVRRVVVTNVMEHENFGDLVGTLTHNRVPVVLNNHTFGNGNTNQAFIYEDNDEGDIPGSSHPDGPGSLQDFIGQQGLGLWLLNEQDNSLFNTGRVDNVFIRLDPQSDTNGVVATIQPDHFFYDFIDVPPAATNLTVCVDFIPPSTGPVQLYLRYGDQPTQTAYDFTKMINSPGSCLTISRTDLPPLRPGRYYVGIFNPTASPQTVRLTWSFGLDPNGVNPTPITAPNPGLVLPDDALTNNTIFISNNQNIVMVNVGVVLQHPRVSDLDLTLIAPTGQRILLFENRGGVSATNMGHLNVFTNFFGSTSAGDSLQNNNDIGPVPPTGTLIIDYDFFQIADQLEVFDGALRIFSSGLISGNGTFTIPYNLINGNLITIVMNRGNNQDPSTKWTYTPRVVTQDYTYLTFTDDTNVTDMPIKFAIPPYDATDDGTNFTLNDFELATNGEYIAAATIPDGFGGWTMTTNDVFIRTNYFGDTNLLSMATNQVSVVTDPRNAANGSNFLALARGSISRTISLVPTRDYDITFRYRGPGIAGWWRGEGNASDSADPETLGNNGNLVGRFNFPAGEVGQAFAMEDSGLAFEFAGTNTYVQIPQSFSLDVGHGSGFTVEGWINPTNVTYQQPMVEWLAHVPANPVVNGQSVTNLAILAGPFLNRATSHYYYLLSPTNWTTSELWANALGGHLAEIDDANEQNWVYDTFAQFAGSNYTMWIGLTNGTAPNTNFAWSTGNGNVVYTNWSFGQPTNCPTSHYTAVLSATNGLPGLWTLLDNNGLTCGGAPANKPFGVVEVNDIQPNGVQFWVSITNATHTGNGRLYANIFDTNGAPHEIFSAAGLIQSNLYQHVALTYDTNNGVANLYYNGTNVASTNLGIFVPKTDGDVLIGKDMSRATNNFFFGRMDEMSIYSRFLSPSEIRAIYQVSVSTTNRNLGKFDPAITPSESLGEAQVSFGGITNLIFGNNNNWQVQGFSLKALSNSLPVQVTGIEPGVLLDSFGVFQKPPGNLYYFPEQALQDLVGSNAMGNWTLEIRDARTGAVSTNAQLISWQLQFILQTNIAPPIQLSPQSPGTNTVPPGQIAYFTVFVPSWANNATNLLVSATAPVDLLFNQTTPPGLGSPGDFTFVPNTTSGSNVISAVPPSTPPLVQGQTYYLGVRNNGSVPSTVVVRVDFNMTTLTNGLPFTSTLGTSDLERPFVFNVSSNATEATFELLKMSGNADLVLRRGLPLPTLLDSDYGSFSGSNANEAIYVLTNSMPIPLATGPWYLDVVKRSLVNNPGGLNAVTYSVLAKQLTNAPQVISLFNRVPLNYTAGPGVALTNFFKFSVTNFPLTGATNLGLRFELFNQSGNGDLTVQTNVMPLAPPFLQSSRLPLNNSEIIFIRTNTSSTNLNADWYLGVPNNETNPINFTILAEIETNSFAAFPTAEGAGAYTRGGALSTNVYHVTTMADSGFGSLRYGLNILTNGGTIVFDKFGTNNLSTPLVITNSNLTIAGQTAPGSGVTIVGAPTYIQGAHDVILRYLRFQSGVNLGTLWSGGFEGQSQTFDVTGYFAQGWHVDAGNIDLLPSGYNGALAFEGNSFIDLNGTLAGTISTNVATVVGKPYTLSFAYSKNPDIASAVASVRQNGNTLATWTVNITNQNWVDTVWVKTSIVFTATSSTTQIQFVSQTVGAAGVLLDAVSLSANSSTPYSIQFTNSSNIIADHISTAYGTKDVVGVLSSSNVTVQWSMIGEGANTNAIESGGSEIRYGSGDVTFHHNLYADNYSGNPTIGEDVSLDFENNVIFNWGLFSGFSTNDLADNPGGLTNFLNYSANYLIAGSNSVLTNVAFWGGDPNTWIFQTNNFIDTNKNTILDGANISWGMFSNQYTPFSHAFDIPPPTAPDEAFIAYERVLDFAGASLQKRDLFDRGMVQRVRMQAANTNGPAMLSGMSAWWKAENNANDVIGANNGVFNGTTSYANGEVGNAFSFDGASYVKISDGPDLRFTNTMTVEAWINLSIFNGDYNEIISKMDDTGLGQNAYTFTVEPGGHLRLNVVSTNYSVNEEVLSSSIIPTNQWVHVAGVDDGAALKVYVNGQLSGAISWNGGIFPGNLPVTIGCTIDGGPLSFFNGKIDELSLYKRALSDCEIAAIYNSGTNGKLPLLIAATNTPALDPLPYLDVDRDGIPDFWEITLGENPTNFSPTLDRDGDGYTDLEEYMNWLGAPHALTVTNQSTNVDLYVLSGNTGNLRFGVANGTNGTVYLTNSNPCAIPGSGYIAVFTPANDFGGGTNYGFGSFTYMVTNLDTTAYFGPVTVSVFVSAVPITNAGLSTNIVIFTNPPPNQAIVEMVPFSITNGASDTDPNAIITYTISTVIDTNAVLSNGWPLTNLTLVPSPTIDTNGIISWVTPTEAQGPGVYIITTIATDNGLPPARATNTFTLTVNEVNRPPVFTGTPPNQTNNALSIFVVSDPATDPDIPGNPLTYMVLNPPLGMTEDTNGIITWTPTAAQAGTYFITNVVTDTNAYALSANSLSATNFFTIVVTPVMAPYVFTQPAQAVTGTSAKLNGMVTPNGPPTTAWFEWGTNTLYGNQTTPVGIGSGYNVVYAPFVVGGLTPNVAYHYRAVASNAVGVVVYGFDQVFQQAEVVAWGADYVRQIEVPSGLSNVVAIAGAYDHSLALKDIGTVVAWGDNTFNQTNVPAGLNNVLAIAGGQYSSMALKNGGTVAAWGGNILSVTNVPPTLNNVIMIAGGTYASLALKNNGSVVSWGANFFSLTNPPAGLNNVVEVAGGSYHSLAIRNDGTIVAWGDNSAGQTNVPPDATNIVAIAGGNYHSLALRSDGTVIAWGDNSSGQTNVPPGLSNVVAVAAGGFHSLALKSDGTVVGWGDNTAGQARIPLGLTNVVAISSGYFHSLALTPTLPPTNAILDITNGVPQTNSVLGGSTIFYQVDVPADADAATNSLLFALNGPLNVWYTTNVPPTTGLPSDYQLLTNVLSGTSVVDTATSPQLMAGKTYYLGLQNTNAFSISYIVQVDFHLVPIAPLTNGVPETNAIPSGGLTFYQVDVPTNADFATNLLFAGTGPLDIWFSTNVPPSITNANDSLLIGNASNGSAVLSASSTPLLVPGTTYYLGVHNTNAISVTYGIGVNFHFPGSSGPSTNTIPITSITKTNINGTNGFLLVWFAPTNDYFQVQWSPGLLQPWNTFTNIIGYHTFIYPTNSEFEFFDDGSQTGGTLGSGRIYRLILLASPPPFVMTGGSPISNSIPANTVSFYQVNVPTNADYATNLLLSSTLPLNVWFSTNNPPTVTNANDVQLMTNVASGTSTFSGTTTPLLVPGGTYYVGVQNTNVTAANFSFEVDFHLLPILPATNAVPISSIIHTNSNGTNGFLLVWYAPSNYLFQVQWSPGLLQPWTSFTNIVAYHTFIAATNSEFEFFDDGSQTGGTLGAGRIYRLILLSTSTPNILPLTNSLPASNSVTAGSVTYYQVNVPTNADFGTNLLLSGTGPLNLWFSTNYPPTVGNANDSLLITNIATGSSVINPSGSPKLIPGSTYYLGVQNTNGSAVSFALQVDFHLAATGSSTNPIPISSITTTNIGGTNNFMLVWFAPTNDLFQVQWSSTFPPSWFTFTNVVAYDTFISATNSKFVFLDDGSQSGGFGALRYYRLLLYNPASPSVTVISLTNGVPVNFTTGIGQTNFFSFDITQTNASVLFELYNLNGNGDLTLQRNSLPVSAPYFTNSANLGTNFEQIVLRTNATLQDINAVSWFLGVPNQSASPINYTIRAILPTNGILVSGLPINATFTRPGGSNVQINWGPTVFGEKYEIRTNSNLVGPNWGALTTIIATNTSMTFTDPTLPSGPLYYRVVQVP